MHKLVKLQKTSGGKHLIVSEVNRELPQVVEHLHEVILSLFLPTIQKSFSGNEITFSVDITINPPMPDRQMVRHKDAI